MSKRTFGQLPAEGFVRTAELLEAVPVSRITLWRWSRNGKIPAPHRIGKTVLWPVSTVRAIIDAASSGQR